ncbi:DUF559 domain-containing protein [Nocardioides antri]|uniref:DUF559 domain-containing protein n=1 Tax=Nocardioides antri TaxID=2607659 RepID=A0A5B1M3T2_9ACTN|nr:DUF559 domain-containing protein [Nocardioides antri]KAA1427434.1 DUF559 domain-containing protein [Nocardioides antri]
MAVAEHLRRLGGVATRRQLLTVCTPHQLAKAVDRGAVVRSARGRYALPEADVAKAAAHAVSGTLCLTSAALEHGWAVKRPPDLPQVALPRNRIRAPGSTTRVEVKRLRLGPDDVQDGVTTPDRTLLDCLRALPFDEALAIADSALRSGYRRQRLLALVRDARGPGAARMRSIAELATADAANPFESVLRAVAVTVPGLAVRPQVSLHRPDRLVVGGGQFLGRPDLVDEELRIVVEADSFEWHGDRAALRSDARRYNAFVVNGWLVLRFSWEDVMLHPDDVRAVLVAAVEERTNQLCPTCRRAS